MKVSGQIFPSADLALGYLAALCDGKASYSHIKNTTRGLWWYFQFWGMELKIKYPKKPKTQVQETLSRKEIAKLIAKCKTPKDNAIIILLACAGIRTKELRSVKVKHVDCKRLTLSIVRGKNFTDRKILITAECAEALRIYLSENYRQPNQFLFSRDANKPLSLEYLRALFRRLEESAKISKRLHVHLFRHSLATNLLLNGADILTVQRQLGHRDPRTTLAYINYTDKLFHRQYQKYTPSFRRGKN